MYSPSSMAQRTGAKRPTAFWYQLPALRQSTKTTLRRQPRHRAQHTAPRKTARREIPSGRSARIRDGAAPDSPAPWRSAPPRPGSARCPGQSPATAHCRTSPRSPPRTEPRRSCPRGRNAEPSGRWRLAGALLRDHGVGGKRLQRPPGEHPPHHRVRHGGEEHLPLRGAVQRQARPHLGHHPQSRPGLHLFDGDGLLSLIHI